IEGTSSLINISAETLKTAIENIDNTIGNINNTLKLSGNQGNQIDNSTSGSAIGCKRACENYTTPPNKVRIFETELYSELGLDNEESSSSDSDIIPKSLTNVFLEIRNSGVGDNDDILESVDNDKQSNLEVYQRPISESVDNNNILESASHEVQQTSIPESVDNNKQNDIAPKRKVTRNKPKYIQHDLAQELLTNLRLCPLKRHKWLWKDIDIINLFKDNENIKTPLSIGVVNFHNNSCIQPLPSSMITYIQKQMENDDDDTIYFDNEKKIGIDIFAIALKTKYNIYSNDVLARSLTESEYNSYVWTPLLCYAFMEKDDIRISSGEVSSVAYDKLKKLAQIQTKSGPRMDSRATIMSISQEVLIQENGRYDNANKRKNDLTKLEYCSKVLLASAYLALPTVARPDIHRFEIYAIQTNASYLFENTICMLGLTDIVIPRTVDAFPKCVEAVCKVPSWK
ncbi:5221_t:CDS:2, partial [Diversispora eburnea]